jgi:hypothetical protein
MLSVLNSMRGRGAAAVGDGGYEDLGAATGCGHDGCEGYGEG